ncbi:MAG: magnesium/cobalt transporter CorA [Dysgonomonas sp.]|nr:magnesium/cobalt transporter CorA [Dysgonomonas sp.]
MTTSNSKETRPSRHLRNNRVLDTLTYLGNFQIPTTIELIQYNQQQYQSKKVESPDKLKELINPDYINWFKITGISDVDTIYRICKSFGIQRFDIKDLLSSRQVTKVILYERTTFILMSECNTRESLNPSFEQIAFILGKNFIISFQENNSPVFNNVKEAIKTSKVSIREKAVDYLLYILLNDVHSSYNDTLIRQTDKISDIEDKLIDNNTQGINIMKFIQIRKKEYSFMKRAVSSIREEYINLLHNNNKLIREENRMYFNDFDDRLRTTLDDLEIFFLSISSLSDLYFNNNNLQLNNIIKKLTIVSTIFIPLTFMVGVWGMNFEFMPELHWQYGYIFAWGIMAVIIILAIFYLKHKKWF